MNSWCVANHHAEQPMLWYYNTYRSTNIKYKEDLVKGQGYAYKTFYIIGKVSELMGVVI